MARSVVFDIIANTRGFTKGMSEAQRSATQFQRHTSRLRNELAGAFAGAAVVAGIRKVVAAARESEAISKVTEARLRSTGGAAHVTAKQISDLATTLSRKVGVDDEVIQSGENMLLTFKGVRNEAGKGNDIFNQTTKTALDLAAGMHQGQVSAEGLQGANILLGKALEDPIKGLTALRRVGVSFTEQQREQIKTLVASGHQLEAQKIILKAVGDQFGGTAEANATASKKLGVAWGNLQEGLGKALIPAIERGATWLNKLVEGFNRLDETSHGVASQVVLTGAVLGGLAVAVAKVTTPVLDARKAWLAYRATKVAQIAVDAQVGAAEEALAVKTAAAGTAATGAGVGFGALAGKLLIYGAAAAAAVEVAAKLSTEHGRQTAIIDRHGSILDRIKRSTTVFGIAQDDAKKSTQAATAATQDSTTELAGNTSKLAANAAKATELITKLKDLKQQFTQQADAIKQSILAYDGLISKSKTTAAEVVRDLRNQVANFKTYSADVHRLIKAGVNPAAIQELSQKGPQYVHALATGSARELAAYKKAWHDRQAEVKGSFAASMQAQYADLVRKMRAMQREINKLKGKSVTVSADAKVTIAKTTIAYLRAFHVKAPQFATGGPVSGPGTGTSDSVPAWLSAGEYVVNARAAARHRQELEWINADRYATGGVVGPKLDRVLRADAQATRIMGQSLIGRVAATLGRAIAKAIDKAASAGGGAPGIKAFILSTDRLPYRWGAAGPGAYDCSGLVGAVYGKMRGDRRAGHGARYFTTGSISTGVPGLKSGLGGLLNIGVTAGSGHMAGSYGGLGFEARSTRTGIFTGRAARSPSSFARHYHMASGGLVGLAGQLSRVRGLDVAGDPSRMTVVGGRFRGYDRGGWLPTGLSLAYNGTGRPERVGSGLSRADADLLADAFLRALERRPPVVRVDEVHRGLLAHKRGRGNIALGLG